MTGTLRIAAGLAVAELGILVGPGPVRVAAGLALALVLPGLVLTRAIRRWGMLQGAEQPLFVSGLSLAIAIVTGLALDGAGIRLTTTSWAVALGLFCAAGLVAVAAGELSHGAPAASDRARPPSISLTAGLMLAGAVLGAGAAVVVGVTLQRNTGRGFTELWALRPPVTRPVAVQLGVRSHEKRGTGYRILVAVAGRKVRDESFSLRPGETWQVTQPIATPKNRVSVTLLKNGRDGVYRRVRLAADARS